MEKGEGGGASGMLKHYREGPSASVLFFFSSYFGQRCAAYHGSRFWNNLLDYKKLCSSCIIFSKITKQYLMSKLR